MKKLLVAAMLFVLLAFSLPNNSQASANESTNIPLPMFGTQAANFEQSMNIPLPMFGTQAVNPGDSLNIPLPMF